MFLHDAQWKIRLTNVCQCLILNVCVRWYQQMFIEICKNISHAMHPCGCSHVDIILKIGMFNVHNVWMQSDSLCILTVEQRMFIEICKNIWDVQCSQSEWECGCKVIVCAFWHVWATRRNNPSYKCFSMFYPQIGPQCLWMFEKGVEHFTCTHVDKIGMQSDCLCILTVEQRGGASLTSWAGEAGLAPTNWHTEVANIITVVPSKIIIMVIKANIITVVPFPSKIIISISNFYHLPEQNQFVVFLPTNKQQQQKHPGQILGHIDQICGQECCGSDHHDMTHILSRQPIGRPEIRLWRSPTTSCSSCSLWRSPTSSYSWARAFWPHSSELSALWSSL